MISFQVNQNLAMNDPQSLLDPNLFLECYQIFEKQVKIDKVLNSVIKRLLLETIPVHHVANTRKLHVPHDTTEQN